MAVDMFLKIGDIESESRDSKYAKWIDVLAWSWGMTQSGSMHTGGGGGAGKVNVNDLSATKYIDSSSADLMLKCASGKHYPEATLIVRKAGDKPLEYLKIVMTDVLITSVSTGGSGGEDRLTENVSMNFAKVKVDYVPQKRDGSAEAAKNFGWDIEANVQA